ncbi:hypothetical protein NA57DRAFT_70091 [Rhizodiscina lignyota]|uniref:Uncharacterized protein n=1 Tax=Rhizodiscina lignyota TaxID=1504668 RepID=A0A9P4ILS2_9PEZI|nr:hypothetical protein NA57DRAFT_70091 [Rhizodiscina lignyota]
MPLSDIGDRMDDLEKDLDRFEDRQKRAILRLAKSDTSLELVDERGTIDKHVEKTLRSICIVYDYHRRAINGQILELLSGGSYTHILTYGWSQVVVLIARPIDGSGNVEMLLCSSFKDSIKEAWDDLAFKIHEKVGSRAVEAMEDVPVQWYIG